MTDCTHESASGVDQAVGPDKVWRCDECGALYRDVTVDGISRAEPVADDVDWRDMFWRYSNQVGYEEGVDFVDRVDWSPVEQAALRALAVERAGPDGMAYFDQRWPLGTERR